MGERDHVCPEQCQVKMLVGRRRILDSDRKTVAVGHDASAKDEVRPGFRSHVELTSQFRRSPEIVIVEQGHPASSCLRDPAVPC